jgi:hypothetical protein
MHPKSYRRPMKLHFFHFPMPILIMATAVIFTFANCKTTRPTALFQAAPKTPKPDYTLLDNWAAHPDRHDTADSVPSNSTFRDEQATSQADVFFLHPTTFTKGRDGNQWNADLNDTALNAKTDGVSILYQASIFNGVGKIYAPRYRQAHLYAFFTKDTASAHLAFELAYQDVRAAFVQYLEKWNQGRPIIIAAHSQGMMHAKRLMDEFFDKKPLRNRLVMAYILGLPISKTAFQTIPLCENPDQTGCYVTWRTFRMGYEPKAIFPTGNQYAVVNPLTMRSDTTVGAKVQHEGAVLFGFQQSPVQMLETQIHNGILWSSKPQFRGSFLYRTGIYHAGDFNLFYVNVRHDVERRLGLFWKR